MIPINDKIFAKPIRTEEKSDAGIILSNRVKKNYRFEVLAVGPKVKHCKVGDVIQKFAGQICPAIIYNDIEVEVLREGSDVEFVIGNS